MGCIMPADNIAVFVEPACRIATEIHYTISVLLTTLGLSYRRVDGPGAAAGHAGALLYADAAINAEAELPGIVQVIPSNRAASFFHGDAPHPTLAGHVVFRGGRLPVLFADESLGEADASTWIQTARSTGACRLPADILASAFWFLSRWEEVHVTDRDALGRFRYQDSLYALEPTCTTTVVDGYLAFLGELLRSILEFRGRRPGQAPMWKDGAPFACCLSHDIDSVRKWELRRALGEAGYVRKAFRQAGVRGALGRLARTAASLVREPNPHGNVLELARREHDLGIRATYFFLAGKYHTRDANYDLRRPAEAARLARPVQELGHEVALHGSFLSGERPAQLRAELQSLKGAVGPVAGQRQHFLRFASQVSWPAYEMLGLEYDSSLAFAEQVGSRAGFSYPFPPYDLTRRRPFSFLEIPLTVMDATLYHYRQLEAVAAWPVMESAKAEAAASGGCVTLLWHNASFDDLDLPGYGRLFWRAVEWARERGAWIAPLVEVARWWRERAATLGEGGAWVEGPALSCHMSANGKECLLTGGVFAGIVVRRWSS